MNHGETFDELDDLDEQARRLGARKGMNIATPGWAAGWKESEGVAVATIVGLVPVGKAHNTCDWVDLAATMREIARAMAHEEDWSHGLSEPISAAIQTLDLLNHAFKQAPINEIDLLPLGWMLLVEVDGRLLSRVEELGVEAKKLASVFESLGVRVTSRTVHEPKGPPPPNRRAAVAHTRRVSRQQGELE